MKLKTMTVDFNYILKTKNSDKGIGPVWKISGYNLAPLAPLAQWILDGDGKGHSLITHGGIMIKRMSAKTAPLSLRGGPPALIKRAEVINADPLVSGGTPSAYYFATPPVVEVTLGDTPTINARRNGMSIKRGSRALY